VLLNTSFNVAGEPIVTTAREGYLTFRRCGIDVLAAGPALVLRGTLAAAASPKELAWRSENMARSGAV
jgi:carbamoyltransferase